MNDALFHAGLNSGSQYEWEDVPNRLHVIDVHKDSRGILSYRLGVRSLDGSGAQIRGVSLTPGAQASASPYSKCTFALANPGTNPVPQKERRAAPFEDDIYRMSVTADSPEWSAQLQNALVAVKPGGSVPIDVYVAPANDAARAAIVTLNARSETDSSKTAAASCVVNP